jgi:glycerol-3-phosphate cytidylyltransferase|tara:strand:+ start:6088 stop:6495 length:408 start_codon:yes stop_codon:yes gene_type:complete
MKKGFIAGSFDLMHPGYIMSFVEAKRNCDYLIVGLQDDPTVNRKEKNKPINSLFERQMVLSAIKYIDLIVPYNTEEELKNLLSTLRPDIRFLGDDYENAPKSYITGYLCCENIHFISRSHGYSTSKLREKIIEQR